MARVYKIFRLGEWQDFAKSGAFAGSPDDARDGFIHLSTAAQVAATLDKHFGAEPLVVLAEIEAGALGAALRFEPSRGGALFPHLYAVLGAHSVLRAARLVRSAGGLALPPWVESA